MQDNDVYRGTLRPQIRQWLDQVTERPNHEWLIVHVTATRTAGSKFIRKGTVLDKMRADWNSGKRDRCVRLVPPASLALPTAHSAATDAPRPQMRPSPLCAFQGRRHRMGRVHCKDEGRHRCHL